MYSIPEDATTATNKGARMAENPTGAMLGDETTPASKMNSHTSPRSLLRVFKYILYTMLIESTEIWKIYLGAVCITDSAVVQEKQTTK